MRSDITSSEKPGTLHHQRFGYRYLQRRAERQRRAGEVKVVRREVVVTAVEARYATQALRFVIEPREQPMRRQLFESFGRDAAFDSEIVERTRMTIAGVSRIAVV